MLRLFCCSVVIAAIVIGCIQKSTSPTPGHAFTVRGELAAGVECPVIVTKDGHRYSVAGDLGSFKVGDRVCLKGTIAQVSVCMSGEATISLEAIGSEQSCP